MSKIIGIDLGTTNSLVAVMTSRLFEELAGPGRDRLSYLIDFFEHALESQNPEELRESTLLLDDFMRSFYHEEGEHQPE